MPSIGWGLGALRPETEILATAPVPAGIATPDVLLSSGQPVDLPPITGDDRHDPVSVTPPRVGSSRPNVQGIPDVAMTAYQRSRAVMDASDVSCHLDWAIVAAIGQIEHD